LFIDDVVGATFEFLKDEMGMHRDRALRCLIPILARIRHHQRGCRDRNQVMLEVKRKRRFETPVTLFPDWKAFP